MLYIALLFVNIPNYIIIDIMMRVFANGPDDQGSTSGRIIPKTQNMVLGPALLNTQHYKVRIKGKWFNPVKGVAPCSTHRCSSD